MFVLPKGIITDFERILGLIELHLSSTYQHFSLPPARDSFVYVPVGRQTSSIGERRQETVTGAQSALLTTSRRKILDIYEPKGISQEHMDPLGAGDLVHRDADDEGEATGKRLRSRALRDLCSKYKSMIHPGRCLFFDRILASS